MKLSELQANTEYAQICGTWRNYKIRITESQLAQGLSRRYGYKGQIEAEVWDTLFRESKWIPRFVPISQIKMTWAEFEIKQAETRKLIEEENKRNEEIRKQNQERQDAFWAFIQNNETRLRESGLITQTYLSRYDIKGERLGVTFNQAQLENLLAKLAN